VTLWLQAATITVWAGDLGLRSFWTARQVTAQREDVRSWRESLAEDARRNRARRVRGYLHYPRRLT
jgi:hypothetical protein